MSNSHKSKLESLAYSEAKVKGQLSDEFYNETQNIDKLQLNENELAKDHQYKDMLKDLPLSERLQRQKQQAGKDISELPQYQGKKVSAKDLLGWNNNNEESDEDDEEEEDGINTGLGKQIELEGEDDEEEDDEDDDEENLKNDEQLQKLLGQVSDEDEEDDEGEDSEVLRRINGLGEDDEDEDEEEVDEEEQERIDMIGESDSDEDKDQQIYKNKQIAAQYQKQVDSKTQSKSKIDKLMNQIEEEDKQAKPQKQEEKGNEVERAKHTKNQILYWRQQTMDRISLQKSLDLVKKLPKEMNYYSKLNGQKKIHRNIITLKFVINVKKQKIIFRQNFKLRIQYQSLGR